MTAQLERSRYLLHSRREQNVDMHTGALSDFDNGELCLVRHANCAKVDYRDLGAELL
jgi:hypothetical protein